jgi:multisubunit Na+/H+ antiporter MnhB subunit
MNEKTRRRPVLGFFAGLVFGLGLALMLAVLGVIPMSLVWLGVVVGLCAVLGIVAAYLAPARAPKM